MNPPTCQGFDRDWITCIGPIKNLINILSFSKPKASKFDKLPLENSFIYFEDLNPMSLQLPFETGLNVPVSVVVKL